MINLRKLNKELKQAGISFAGVNDEGIVWGVDGKTEIQNRPDVFAIINSHDPNPEPDVDIFENPIITPALYAGDVYVSSRDIKDDPYEAFAEALAETSKKRGEPKSLDLIARSTLKALEKAIKEIEILKQEIEKLKKVK